MSDAVLTIAGLRRTYVTGEGSLEVLKGIDLSVADVEVVGLRDAGPEHQRGCDQQPSHEDEPREWPTTPEKASRTYQISADRPATRGPDRFLRGIRLTLTPISGA